MVYKKFVKKNHKTYQKYVEFSPHLKNFGGISKSLVEELIRLSFNIVNTALGDIVEAIENASSKGLGKKILKK